MSIDAHCPACGAVVVMMNGKPWACHNCHWRAEGPQSWVHRVLRRGFTRAGRKGKTDV